MNALQKAARLRLQAMESRAELLAHRIARNQATSSGADISFGTFEYEQNEALRGEDRWKTLDRMQNDPRIAGTLRFSTLPLQRASWNYEAASQDRRDREIAAFVNANLLRKASKEFGFGREFYVQTSWIQRLGEILQFLPHGRSVFVSTMKRAPGLKQVFDRLQWVEPSTISGARPWVTDSTDRITAIQRSYTRPDNDMPVTDEEIPAARVRAYGWEVIGARYDGRPFTRPNYGAWFRKDFLLRMGAIWTQKVGAPPPWGAYPATYGPDDREKFQSFIESLRGTAPAHAFGVFPQGPNGEAPTVGYAGTENGDIDRVSTSVNLENAEIAAGGGTKSMLLGETASGSRALGSSLGMIEMVFVEAVAEFVIEWETHGMANLSGLVEELVARNYSGVTELPKLKVSEINPYFLVGVASELVQASNAGLIPKHESVQRQVSAGFGLDLPEEAFEPQDVPAAPGGGGGGSGGGGDGPPTGPDESIDELRARIRQPPDQLARSGQVERIRKLLRPVEDLPPRGGGFLAGP